jgi:replicative DNA helicase
MTDLPLLVLRLMLTKGGWLNFNHLVRADTFDTVEYRHLYQQLEKLHDDTDDDLTFGGLRAALEIQFRNKPDQLFEMREILERVEKQEVLDQALATQLVKRFLERSVSYEIAEYVANHADSPDFSITTVTDLVERAVEVGGRVGKSVASIFGRPLSGSLDSKPPRNGVGFSRQLDVGLRGGVGPGELCIYLAPPSRGKTSYLCFTGARLAARGKGVLHITLEINERKVTERYDQAWTGLAAEDLEAPEGQQAIQAARDLVQEKGGHVWSIDWAYMTVSANDIGALVRQMRGLPCECCGKPMLVDAIVLDYLEEMSPNKFPGREMRQSFSAVGKEARALAINLDLPLYTAWQANRPANDKDLLGAGDVSESWDIIKKADQIIGLNQSLAELHNKRMRVNIIKQRESTDRGVYELFSDLDCMVVRDVTHEDHTEALKNALSKSIQVARKKGSDGDSGDGGGGVPEDAAEEDLRGAPQ